MFLPWPHSSKKGQKSWPKNQIDQPVIEMTEQGMPNNYGGKRHGAGRKPVGEENKASHRSITLPATLWQKVDRLKGELSASKYLAKLVEKAKG